MDYGSVIGGITGLASSLLGGDDSTTQTTKVSIPKRDEEQQAMWDVFVNMMLPGEANYEFDADWYLQQHPEVNEWIEQGEYARPKIPGYEFNYDTNEYEISDRGERPWGVQGQGSLEQIIKATEQELLSSGPAGMSREDIYNQRYNNDPQALREDALERIGLTPEQARTASGQKRTPYMHYEQIGKGKGWQPSAEAAENAQMSIFDKVGAQQDWLRSQGQDYVGSLEQANQAERTGITDATNTYVSALNNLPSTTISIGGQPIGNIIHQRPMNVAGKAYQAQMALPMRVGEMDRMVAGEGWNVDQQYPKYAGDLAKFSLIKNIVDQMEDRRYRTATQSATETRDHGFNLMGALSSALTGAQQGGDAWSLIQSAGNAAPVNTTRLSDYQLYGQLPSSIM